MNKMSFLSRMGFETEWKGSYLGEIVLLHCVDAGIIDKTTPHENNAANVDDVVAWGQE